MTQSQYRLRQNLYKRLVFLKYNVTQHLYPKCSAYLKFSLSYANHFKFNFFYETRLVFHQGRLSQLGFADYYLRVAPAKKKIIKEQPLLFMCQTPAMYFIGSTFIKPSLRLVLFISALPRDRSWGLERQYTWSEWYSWSDVNRVDQLPVLILDR